MDKKVKNNNLIFISKSLLPLSCDETLQSIPIFTNSSKLNINAHSTKNSSVAPCDELLPFLLDTTKSENITEKQNYKLLCELLSNIIEIEVTRNITKFGVPELIKAIPEIEHEIKNPLNIILNTQKIIIDQIKLLKDDTIHKENSSPFSHSIKTIEECNLISYHHTKRVEAVLNELLYKISKRYV